ncbi:uncharacterized protein LOC126735454 isoform X1 [Anthonomus grandis grandis]|uniref:uncharacterized protein LOC126735454 isoform X1 n=1 Tax=Anthonomus grandis grandis TaxID=2921223 RepID=UPI00216541AB|nr:uncharacterized protein LOC126735454 isoform X1 [Anthonomus grandis grandis]XP_050295400.1 uncharacterized protein LOC126735454 isoform X1 [Anthonomus grandis grandis]XP_050295401.1 uncharacterized protein LOC126735454 isoform X1 [Anthonomus grandis grandis]
MDVGFATFLICLLYGVILLLMFLCFKCVKKLHEKDDYKYNRPTIATNQQQPQSNQSSQGYYPRTTYYNYGPSHHRGGYHHPEVTYHSSTTNVNINSPDPNFPALYTPPPELLSSLDNASRNNDVNRPEPSLYPWPPGFISSYVPGQVVPPFPPPAYGEDASNNRECPPSGIDSSTAVVECYEFSTSCSYRDNDRYDSGTRNNDDNCYTTTDSCIPSSTVDYSDNQDSCQADNSCDYSCCDD